MGEPGLVIAFAAGLISITSPCCLPLLPGYLAYLTGLAGDEPARRTRTVAAATLFVLGFSAVFIALGATASELGALLFAYRLPVERVAGIFIGLEPAAGRRQPLDSTVSGGCLCNHLDALYRTCAGRGVDSGRNNGELEAGSTAAHRVQPWPGPSIPGTRPLTDPCQGLAAPHRPGHRDTGAYIGRSTHRDGSLARHRSLVTVDCTRAVLVRKRPVASYLILGAASRLAR